MDHLYHTPQVCIGFLHLFPYSFCRGCCHRHLTLHIAHRRRRSWHWRAPTNRTWNVCLWRPLGVASDGSGQVARSCTAFSFPGRCLFHPFVQPSFPPSLLHSIASPAAPLQRLAASSRPPAGFSPSPGGTNGRALHAQRGLPFQVGCSGASEGVWREKDPQSRSR